MLSLETIQTLSGDHALDFVEYRAKTSEEFRILDSELRGSGLRGMNERTRLYTVYSAESRQPLSLSITPYVSDAGDVYGGLSVSSGGHAKAVVVHLSDDLSIESFETLSVTTAGVVRDAHKIEELGDDGGEALARKLGPIKSTKPYVELAASQIRSITDLAHNSLLRDSSSRSVHSRSEVRALQGQHAIVGDIANFMWLRSIASPGGCSCSSSCWGCSSCSCSWG